MSFLSCNMTHASFVSKYPSNRKTYVEVCLFPLSKGESQRVIEIDSFLISFSFPRLSFKSGKGCIPIKYVEAGSAFVPAQKANRRAYAYMLAAGLLNVQNRISSTIGRNFLIFYKRKAPIILSPHDHLFCPLVYDA